MTSRAGQFVFTVVGLLMIVAPLSTAHSAAFWLYGRGVSNYARGGANVASPGDPTAIYLNPAALSDLKGLNLLLDANILLDHGEFSRAADDLDNDGTNTTYESVGNEMKPTVPSPGLFASYNMASAGMDDLTLAMGIYGPIFTYQDWPKGGPQRYSIEESHNVQAHAAFGAGYQLPWMGLKVGATALLTYFKLNTDLRLNAGFDVLESFSTPENPEYDAMVHLDMTDSFTSAGIFSLALEPLKGWLMSLTYQLGYEVEASGAIETTLGDTLSDLAEVEGNEGSLKLNIPWVARFANQYRAENFNIELALQYEGWSVNDKALVSPKDIAITSNLVDDIALSDIELKYMMRDTYGIGLGGDWHMAQAFTLRAGTFYERAALGDKRLSPSVLDLNKIGLTLGGRYDISTSTWLDFATGYVHMFEREVKDSNVKLVNPFDGTEQWSIANGTYRNWHIAFMAALGMRFGG
jgi:long-chain fatty acid transport protein